VGWKMSSLMIFVILELVLRFLIKLGPWLLKWTWSLGMAWHVIGIDSPGIPASKLSLIFLSDLIGATWASLARGMMPLAGVFSRCRTFLTLSNLYCGYYLLPFTGFLLEISVHVDKDSVPFHKQLKEVCELFVSLVAHGYCSIWATYG